MAEILHSALNTDKVDEVKKRVLRLRKSHQRVNYGYSFETSPAYFYR